MTTTTTTTVAEPGTGLGPLDPVGTDLIKTLKALKLGGLKDTLPERLALARQRKMGHAAFLELVLADEITRRESRSAMLRARAAGLDPSMRLDTWDELDDLTYDRTLLSDLTSLRFTEAGNGILVLGPVGPGFHCAFLSRVVSSGPARAGSAVVVEDSTGERRGGIPGAVGLDRMRRRCSWVRLTGHQRTGRPPLGSPRRDRCVVPG